MAAVPGIDPAWRWKQEKPKPAPAIKQKIDEITGIAEVLNKDVALINNNAAHQAKWRLANLETNRRRARDGMRKRRAEQKDNS